MRRISFILAALILSTFAAGCGQKGALKLPQDPPASPAKSPAPESGK